MNVERRPVNRPVTEADQAFKETSVEMRETAEKPVVSKSARVIEEVVISKEARDRTETVRDTVRRTEVKVEPKGQATSGRTNNFDQWNNDFQTNYRTNFAKSGYSYDQFLPAYRYGYALGSDPNYQGDWTKVEQDARSSWEAQNKGTWNEFKDAIRYAWDKARSSLAQART